MNKKELINLMKVKKKENLFVLSSESLVLREIYDIAYDLDMLATTEGLEIN